MRTAILFLAGFLIATNVSAQSDETILIEAESFKDHGGWKLDTQFISEMGSPYLLAHGLGNPVANSNTTFKVKRAGRYHLFVRTKDWVARWNAPGKPGRFQVVIDGEPIETEFGAQGAQWHWHKGTAVQLEEGEHTLQLKDLTGFDGRCDAICLSTSQSTPPNQPDNLSQWRKKQLNLPKTPQTTDRYDLVVVGGGYSGMGAAISAARAGCKVALIQNRGVLGGNGSSEVRVWAKGKIRRGRFPAIGEIIEEFADKASRSPGRFEEFGDDLKLKIVKQEPNIDLFLHHHAYKVEVIEKRITAVFAFDTRTSLQRKFRGNLFSDCTGHGTIGFLAGAESDMKKDGRMGMSNMWRWEKGKTPIKFPETPWALNLEMGDFPYPHNNGEWFWESGYDKDPLNDAEGIRDWNFRAVYGAFNAMKNRGGTEKHSNAYLSWIAYIGGPRESRRLLGDVILTQDDVVKKRDFPDGCVPSTWSIDLHYPKKRYAKKFPDNPFISKAVHGIGVDRSYGYPVPYRCFYSRNITNLFMAGRCISVTHQALGTVRVMKTCGMMGEVVGKAASVCRRHGCFPREVYSKYLEELKTLLKLPGKARRNHYNEDFVIPEEQKNLSGQSLKDFPGNVLDDTQGTFHGNWGTEGNLTGYLGVGYRYSNDPKAKALFRSTVNEDGKYVVSIKYLAHQNRSKNVSISVRTESQKTGSEVTVNQKKSVSGFVKVAEVTAKKGEQILVEISPGSSGGHASIDAIQLLKSK